MLYNFNIKQFYSKKWVYLSKKDFFFQIFKYLAKKRKKSQYNLSPSFNV